MGHIGMGAWGTSSGMGAWGALFIFLRPRAYPCPRSSGVGALALCIDHFCELRFWQGQFLLIHAILQIHDATRTSHIRRRLEVILAAIRAAIH